MSSAEYLRRQADACMRIARSCFDLSSAERIRVLAAEMRAKAAEIDAHDTVHGHMLGRENSSGANSTRRR